VAFTLAQNDPTAIPYSRIAPRSNVCRTLTEDFSSWSDFGGYTIPAAPSYDDGKGTKHSLEVLSSGASSYNAYKASIYATSTDLHAAYATYRYADKSTGPLASPAYVDFYFLMQGLTIPSNGFASIGKFSPNAGTLTRYITLDVDSNYMLHLNFVPNQSGDTVWLYQNFNNPLPANKWVNITVYMDWSSTNGIAAVWQDGVIQSVANLNGGSGFLQQAHMGLIASGNIGGGTVYNYAMVSNAICGFSQAPSTTTTTAAPGVVTTTTTARPTAPTTVQPTASIPIPTPDSTPAGTSDPGRNTASKAIPTLAFVVALVAIMY
jgi:hypothetical protein